MKALISVPRAGRSKTLAVSDKPRHLWSANLPRFTVLLGTIAFLCGFALIGNFTQSLAEINAQDKAGITPTSSTYSVVTYHAPRLEGFDLDTRLTRHRQSSTLPTAERYCRERGYSSAYDFAVRPSIATRTMGDNVVHIDRSGRQQAFAMIQCKMAPNSTEKISG